VAVEYIEFLMQSVSCNGEGDSTLEESKSFETMDFIYVCGCFVDVAEI